MKKFIIIALFVSTCSFGQSFSITPTAVSTSKIMEIRRSGPGLDHRSLDNTIGIGTYVDNTYAYVQTHTNHPLRFTTNGGSTQLILATNGSFGVGNITPTQKLHVDGNANVTSTTGVEGLISGNSLTIGSGGTPINKFMKVYLPGAINMGLSANVCSVTTYNVTGVSSDDAVILNIESAFGSLHVAAVIPGENEIKVKFCNVSNSATVVSVSDVRFTIIK